MKTLFELTDLLRKEKLTLERFRTELSVDEATFWETEIAEIEVAIRIFREHKERESIIDLLR